MNDGTGILKDLLNATLLPFAAVIAAFLQVMKNLWTNSIRGEFPRWGDAALAAAALAVSAFFVALWKKYLPEGTEPSLLNDAYMQTAILWIGTVSAHFVLKSAYGSGRPVGTADELRAYVTKADPIVADRAGVTMSDLKPPATVETPKEDK